MLEREVGWSNMIRSWALAWPVAAAFLTSGAWAQGSGMNTGGNTQLPINVSGKVAMEDGAPPREKVNIATFPLTLMAKRAVKVAWHPKELEHLIRILKTAKPEWQFVTDLEEF